MRVKSARAMSVILRIFCVIPFVTGLAELIGGTWILEQTGVPMPPAVAFDPLLNSQMKFWGAIWFGYGLMLWWVAGDLRERAQTLQILLVTMFIAGIGRALSHALYGSPGIIFDGAMLIEIIGSPSIWLWHRRLLPA